MKIILLISIPVFLGVLAGVGAIFDGQVSPEFVATAFLWVKWMGIAFLGLWLLNWFASRQPVRCTIPFESEEYAINERHTQAELDENGSVIAYRYFDLDKGVLKSVGMGAYVAPEGYKDGYLASDRVPTLKNTNGIYAAKTPDSPILEPYHFYGMVKAKVQLSGRIVEGELGYRGQFCKVLEILEIVK
jgi:hypothetical protein